MPFSCLPPLILLRNLLSSAHLCRLPRSEGEMLKRNSITKSLEIKSILFGGVLEVGDSARIAPQCSVIAVQRERQLFYGGEGNFALFSTFSEPFGVPSAYAYSLPIVRRYHLLPNIQVESVNIKGISTSGIVQIGSTEAVKAQSKILHIRQLFDKAADQQSDKK